MPTKWCTTDDVSDKISFVKGSSITPDIIDKRIKDARNVIVEKLAGKFSTDILTGWDDVAIGNMPPQVRRLTAMLAVALVLQECVPDEIISDRSCKAYGFHREALDVIKAIRADEIIVATSQTDSTSVSANQTMIDSSTYGTTKLCNSDRMTRFAGE
jgi:hypothetical protein